MNKITSIGSYKNGNYNVEIFNDGTKIRWSKEDNFIAEFAENIDLKITNRCTGTDCPFCHEGSAPNGKHGDIMNLPFLNSLHPYQEIALGGGNVLEHPDLIPFLKKLKEMKVLTNLTVNQIHFMKNVRLLKKLSKENLIYGLGISLVNPSEQFISNVKTFPNAVIHVINGIVKIKDLDRLCGKGLNLLILGYKKIRRGASYFYDYENKIAEKQMALFYALPELLKGFSAVSFDNLALEQLQVRRLVNEKTWETMYMGDEGHFTFFIDAVDGTFSVNSTAPFEKRYPIKSSVDEMFEIISSEI